MSSHFKSNMVVLLAGAAISKGMAVKKGSDDKHVVKGSANTSKCIGIAQSAPTTAEDPVEVALPGGGAKGLLGENCVAGNLLVSHTDGTLVLANTAGDFVIAQALEDGSAGDLIDVTVAVSHAAVAEA